jgi:curved DNA-binding protein CbpA
MNPYQTLQVYDKASIGVIRAAWAALVRECHPDGPAPNKKRTQALNDAYAILKDPVKRAALDQQLLESKRPKTAPKPENAKVPPRPQGMPGYPDGYPDPYLGMSQESIDSAIEDLSRATGAPPIVTDFLKFAHHQARRRAS